MPAQPITKEDHMENLIRFRQELDQFMRRHPQSPLDSHQKRLFKGLNYYPHTPNYLFELEAHRFPDDDPVIIMQTSTGDSRHYRRWGQISFNAQGETTTLTIYCDRSGQDLFLPFKDQTNRTETYGAGRYLDNHRPGLTILDDDHIEIDFNYAYNPYCAYNMNYSCPLPPPENWLKIPIPAGEKKFTS